MVQLPLVNDASLPLIQVGFGLPPIRRRGGWGEVDAGFDAVFDQIAILAVSQG